MNLYKKIISGRSQSISRLHDEKANIIPLGNFLKHFPKAFFSWFIRLSFGKLPELPWISYSAIRDFKTFLEINPDSRVLEYGSGMSTLWFARHVQNLFSAEDDINWYKMLEDKISSRSLHSCHLEFCHDKESFTNFMAEDEYGFDLILIDGHYRSDCVKNAIKLLRPGGFLYLDNSDKNSTNEGGDMRLAENILIEFASKVGAKITYYVDFAPAQLFVGEGLLLENCCQKQIK